MVIESKRDPVVSAEDNKPKREQFLNQEPLGSGARKTVYAYPDENGDKVIGFFHDYIIQPNERTLRKQFYLTKIVNLLLPKEIPGIYDYGAEPAFIIRERVDFTHLDLASNKDREEYEGLIAKLESIGIEVDRTSLNFVRSRNGTIVYLEELGPYSKAKLMEAITNTLSGDKQEAAIEFAALLK